MLDEIDTAIAALTYHFDETKVVLGSHVLISLARLGLSSLLSPL